MFTIVGSGQLAERVAHHLGHTQRVVLVPSPTGGSAEARLEALAGIGAPRVLLAASDDDEQNLLTAGLAKQRRAGRTAAVVRSRSLAEQRDLIGALGVDRVIRPHAVLAAALASHIYGPVASAVQSLGAGTIRVAEVELGNTWRGKSTTLRDLALPAGARIAVIHREDGVIAPSAAAELREGDRILLVANKAVLAEAIERIGAGQRRPPRTLVVADAARAHDAAGLVEGLRTLELDADFADAPPPPRSVKGEFLVLLGDGPSVATSRGAKSRNVFVVADTDDQRTSANQVTAAEEVARAVTQMLPQPPVERVGTVAAGVLSVYRVEAGDAGEWLDLPLRELTGMSGWTVLAIQAGANSYLPHPEDVIMPRNTLVIAGPPDGEPALERALRGG